MKRKMSVLIVMLVFFGIILYERNAYAYTQMKTSPVKNASEKEKTVTFAQGSRNESEMIFTDSYSISEEEAVLKGDFSFTKVDTLNKDRVEGATFTIYRARGKKGSSTRLRAEHYLKRGSVYNQMLKKVTSEKSGRNGVVTFKGLESGTYYVIRETSASDGYQRSANPIIISTKVWNGQFRAVVIDSGEDTVEISQKNGKVKWLGYPTEVVVRMLSSSGAYLKGTKLELIDKENGKVIDRWTSGATGHELRYLTAGNTYIVRQKNQCTGYIQAVPVSFKVEKHDVVTNGYHQMVTICSKKISNKNMSYENVLYENVLYKNIILLVYRDYAKVWMPSSAKAKKINIPDAIKVNGRSIPVTVISSGAFRGMAKLTSVTIGRNIKYINRRAFNGCRKLKKITIKTTNLNRNSVGANAFKDIHKKAVVKCPKSKKNAYRKLLLRRGMKKTMKFK